jgi:hypothetical protein
MANGQLTWHVTRRFIIGDSGNSDCDKVSDIFAKKGLIRG